MTHGKSKYSMASVSSTYAGDSSSDSALSSYGDEMDMKIHSNETPYVESSWTYPNGSDWSYSNNGFQNFDLDRSEMPSTREPSPEPVYMPSTREPSPEPVYADMPSLAQHYGLNAEYFAPQCGAQGRHLPSQPAFEPQWNNAPQYGFNEGHVHSRVQVPPLPRRSSREAPAAQAQQCAQTVLLVPHDQAVVFVQRQDP